jgi:hypothetical protein
MAIYYRICDLNKCVFRIGRMLYEFGFRFFANWHRILVYIPSVAKPLLRMTIILGCGRITSEFSNKAQSRACNIGNGPRNYGRLKTWVVILLQVWITFSFFISLVYLIPCLFLSLFYLFFFASFTSSVPSFSLFIFVYSSLSFSVSSQRNLITHFCLTSLLMFCPKFCIREEI